MNKLLNNISKAFKSLKGATLVEYVLIATLLGVTLTTVYRRVGNSYQNLFGKINNGLSKEGM